MSGSNIKTANLVDIDGDGHSTAQMSSSSSANETGFKTSTDDSSPRSDYGDTAFRPKPPQRSYDAESPYEDTMMAAGFNFDDKSIRLGFIRRVYSILSIQLLFTFGVVSCFAMFEDLRGFVAQNPITVIIPMIGSFVLILVIACSESARRQSPTNIIVLTLFTICEAFVVGFISSVYDTESVFFAMALTFGIVLALTAFAFQTKIDFTRFGPALMLIFLVFFISSFIVGIVKGFNHDSSRFFFACIGAVLFSLFIVYDTQLMMGGQHKYAISPEEYVHGALIIYLDVINLFIYLLRIFGERR